MKQYVIYAVIYLFVTAVELYLLHHRNKKEPELFLSIKLYGSILAGGNLMFMVYACYMQTVSEIPAAWYFGIWTYLLGLTIYDLKYRELPDVWHIIPIVFYAASWIIGYQPIYWLESALVAVILCAIFGLTVLLKKDAIGLGDVKLLLVCSIYLGAHCIGMLMRGVFVAFFLSIILLIFKKVTTKSGLPFVPFLLLGALLI